MEASIKTADLELKVVMLPAAEYFRMTGNLCSRPEFSEDYPFEAYIEEKRSTEAKLREALSSDWVESVDFEVASDGNIAFTMSGGIYTPRVVCREYLHILCDIIQTARMAERWSYTTAAELQQPLGEMHDCDFVVWRRTIYVLQEVAQGEFVRLFSRSKAEAGAAA